MEVAQRHLTSSEPLVEKIRRRLFINDDGTTEQKPVIALGRLTDIDDPQYANQLVSVSAVIAGNTTSYNVPTKLSVKCVKDHEKDSGDDVRKKCPGDKGKEMQISPKAMASYVDSRSRDGVSKAIAQARLPRCAIISWEEKETDTLYRLRVRPHVTSLIFQQDGKVVDESGVEYKHYDIFLKGKHGTVEPGSVYTVTAQVIPDPKTQKVTLFANELVKDAGSEYDLDKIRQLKTHLDVTTSSLDERVDWLLDNFKLYSKIRERRDVILANVLGFFSPTYIKFDGKMERGWAIILVIGDSTTGKSEISKSFIRLLSGGLYVLAEMATKVGLTATATQMANGVWFVEWGEVVLGDKRLLIVDGSQKLPKQEWATLAESQRLGTVKLTKAAKGEANARTRQIIIANPVNLESFERSTKEMDAFYYPYMALPTLMDIQNIARLDTAVFVNSKDVDIEALNAALNDEPDSYLAYLKDLRALVWEGTEFRTEYSDDFVDTVHEHATELYRKFYVSNMPVVSIDMKFKLARLATSLALATCSFEDDDSLDTVIVTKEHVDFVAKFLDETYTKAGLNEGADRARQGGDINKDKIEELIDNIKEKIGRDSDKIIEIMKWMGLQTSFSKDSLQSMFELNRDKELRPLISILQSNQIISSSGRGFVLTAKGVRAVKLLVAENKGKK
jgi:hypothetical protein